MKVKKTIEKLNRFWKKNGEKIVEYGAEKVQNTFEQVEGEEAYDEAAKTAIEEIKKHPELAMKILSTINENVSAKVAVNAVIQLPEEEEFSGQTAVKATEQLELEDEHKVEIIKESNIDYENKMEIASQLEDKKIRIEIQEELKEEEEVRSLNRLRKIYMKCNENMNEVTLEELLNEVISDIHLDSDMLQNEKNKIIAKKIAFNYATYGTNIVSKQRKLMTPKEMNEMGIVEMAKIEYEKITREYDTINGHKIKKFNEEELRYKILKEIEATALTEEFDEEATFKEIRSMMKALMYDDRKSLLIKLKEEIIDEATRDTYLDMRNTGIVNILSEFPKKEREKMLKIFKDVIDKRKNMEQKFNVVENTPKIKSCQIAGNVKERE